MSIVRMGTEAPKTKTAAVGCDGGHLDRILSVQKTYQNSAALSMET
jgi:hypothetical protein